MTRAAYASFGARGSLGYEVDGRMSDSKGWNGGMHDGSNGMDGWMTVLVWFGVIYLAFVFEGYEYGWGRQAYNDTDETNSSLLL